MKAVLRSISCHDPMQLWVYRSVVPSNVFCPELKTSSLSRLTFLSCSYFHLWEFLQELFLLRRIRGTNGSQLPEGGASLNTGLASRTWLLPFMEEKFCSPGWKDLGRSWPAGLRGIVICSWVAAVWEKPSKAETGLRISSLAPQCSC